jgi:hypothetical protein
VKVTRTSSRKKLAQRRCEIEVGIDRERHASGRSEGAAVSERTTESEVCGRQRPEDHVVIPAPHLEMHGPTLKIDRHRGIRAGQVRPTDAIDRPG